MERRAGSVSDRRTPVAYAPGSHNNGDASCRTTHHICPESPSRSSWSSLRRRPPAQPLFEKTDLFAAGQGGYTLYRIPGIVATRSGTLLAYCEARMGTGSDWSMIDILLRRSTDAGKTWSDPRKVAHVDGPYAKNPAAVAQKLVKPDDVTYNNPVAIADRKTGAVHFLFCMEYMRCFYQRSDDDGRTFSAPVEITATLERFRKDYAWQAMATGPAHGIQLENGRLLVPVWLSRGTGGNAHRPSAVATIYSDDAGKTWQPSVIVANESTPLTNPNETVAVELADGRVMLNMRSESKEHRRAIALSPDGATRWTAPAFDELLKEPICMASLCRYSKKPAAAHDRLLFANPDNLERPGPGGRRPEPRSQEPDDQAERGRGQDLAGVASAGARPERLLRSGSRPQRHHLLPLRARQHRRQEPFRDAHADAGAVQSGMADGEGETPMTGNSDE